MTYLLHIVAREVPANDAEVLPFLEQIAGATISIAPSQQLKSFRDAILKLFPCLTSYGAGDKAVDACPWADGPLADNFKGGSGFDTATDFTLSQGDIKSSVEDF